MLGVTLYRLLSVVNSVEIIIVELSFNETSLVKLFSCVLGPDFAERFGFGIVRSDATF